MSSTDSNVKRPAWRPSEYKPEHCQTVIDCGKAGKSKIQMAVACGVSRTQTLDDWAAKNAEFSTALNMAMALSQDWWETQGQIGVFDEAGRKLNGTYYKQMSARFPDSSWREQKTLEVVGNSEAAPVMLGFAEMKKAKNG